MQIGQTLKGTPLLNGQDTLDIIVDGGFLATPTGTLRDPISQSFDRLELQHTYLFFLRADPALQGYRLIKAWGQGFHRTVTPCNVYDIYDVQQGIWTVPVDWDNLIAATQSRILTKSDVPGGEATTSHHSDHGLAGYAEKAHVT